MKLLIIILAFLISINAMAKGGGGHAASGHSSSHSSAESSSSHSYVGKSPYTPINYSWYPFWLSRGSSYSNPSKCYDIKDYPCSNKGEKNK